MNLNDIHNIYLIGIGGIGMSALSQHFHRKGCQVSGYDRVRSDITQRLEEQGISIRYQISVEEVPEAPDLVIYTPAIPDTHEELQHFRNSSIPVKKRAEVLREITTDNFTIAIAGSHGKTTISAITAHLLKAGNVDCTAFLGGVDLNHNSNYIPGNDDFFVVEADEYDQSFLKLHPNIALISALDTDHLESYGSIEKLQEAFRQFVQQIKPGGTLVYHRQVNAEMLRLSAELKTLSYGQDPSAEVRCHNIRVEKKDSSPQFIFDAETPRDALSGTPAPMPGVHNIENAAGAIAISQSFDIDAKTISKALARFKGIERRFHFHIQQQDLAYIDDYAHHPAEVEAVISTVRQLYPKKTLTAVFQPHLYSRTRDLASEFAESLSLADEIILLEIYPAREAPIEGVSSKLILDQITIEKKQLMSKEELLDTVSKEKLEVLMTLGAGDIDELVQPIIQKLRA